MGQQQLLLLILGAIIVGLAVVVGVTIFQDNAVSSNRDAMTNDMMHLAVKARHYFYRPITMTGGGNSFVGLSADAAGMIKLVSTDFSNNSNAIYTISTAGDATHVIFQGIGKTSLENNSYPTMTITVTQEDQVMTQAN